MVEPLPIIVRQSQHDENTGGLSLDAKIVVVFYRQRKGEFIAVVVAFNCMSI